jgi:transcriptional regulator with XRE-family HTH domain
MRRPNQIRGAGGRTTITWEVGASPWRGCLYWRQHERSPVSESVPPVAAKLRQWRALRRQSQLTLALGAGISARHLSFIEGGRARASRNTILRLGEALELPFRERNELLLAGGFAPAYRETPLSDPEMRMARFAIERLMEQQEPYPAVTLDRYWNVLGSNGATRRLLAALLGPVPAKTEDNLLRMMFDPELLQPHVANWPDVALGLLQRAQRETTGGVLDAKSQRLVEELRAFPGTPHDAAGQDPAAFASPFFAVEFAAEGGLLRFTSVLVTLGTPQDVTLQEIRIEIFQPVDAYTMEAMERLRRNEPR